MTKLIILLALTLVVINSNVASMALEKRRFGQENPAVLQEVRDLGRAANLNNGRFDQIAGAFISTLLAAIEPCARYALIDEVVSLCRANNCLEQGVNVARKLAALEKNFNPFAGANAKPAFCNNPALPASAEVRCVVPVIDPGFGNAQQFNVAANARLAQIQANTAGDPGLCTGQSVLQQAIALGISDCVGCTPGNNGAPNNGAGNNNGANNGAGNNNGANNGTGNNNGADNGTGNNNGANNGTGNNNNGMGNVGANNGQNGANNNQGGGVVACRGPVNTGTANNAGQGNGGNTNNTGAAIVNANQFNGSLFGAPPVVVKDLGANTLRRFQVLKPDGSLDGDFINKNGAIMRACVNQMNACATLANANGGTLDGKNVGDCNQQQSQCHQANGI